MRPVPTAARSGHPAADGLTDIGTAAQPGWHLTPHRNTLESAARYRAHRLVQLRIGELCPPARLLLGPGPSNVHPRVLRALSTPTIGHLDPYFLGIMEETQALLRTLFRTSNALTIPISGTGSAGMETCFANFVEPADDVVIGVNGLFGTRMVDVASRLGAVVHPAEAPWGAAVPPEAVERALRAARRPKLVAIVHAETSTGAQSDVAAIAACARRYDALVLADVVTSLGGCPVDVDQWGVDIAYSATQKCLSCPPGLAPLTVGDRALRVLDERRRPVPSWYLDLRLIGAYWGADRTYHHTAPINMNYALREALRLILEEGLEARFQRHRRNHAALVAGLTALGLDLVVEPADRLSMLTSVRVPAEIDETSTRRRLLQDFHIEIGGGLGPLAGKIWRIGLMGESSRAQSVLSLLAALERLLPGRCAPGRALAAAQESYASSEAE